MLKFLINSLDEVDEQFQGLYEERSDGKFQLKLEDDPVAAQKKKLDEFRSNNRSLHAQKEEMERKLEELGNIDPNKYQEALSALDKISQLEEADLLKEGKVDEIVSKRTETMRSKYEQDLQAKTAALTETTDKYNQLHEQLTGIKIDQSIQSAVEKVGKVRPGAMPDVLNRARSLWKLNEEGKPQAIENGSQKYGASGDPLTMDEWAQDLVSSASFLFDAAGGGGGGGGKKDDLQHTNKKVIKSSDNESFGNNLEDIAKGKVQVSMDD